MTQIPKWPDRNQVIDRPATPTRAANKEQVQPPDMYVVFLHNDNTTPFEFVIGVLTDVFNVRSEKAHTIMMSAHQSGLAQVVTLPRDLAETKVHQANTLARGTVNPVFKGPMELTFSAQPR